MEYKNERLELEVDGAPDPRITDARYQGLLQRLYGFIELFGAEAIKLEIVAVPPASWDYIYDGVSRHWRQRLDLSGPQTINTFPGPMEGTWTDEQLRAHTSLRTLIVDLLRTAGLTRLECRWMAS